MNRTWFVVRLSVTLTLLTVSVLSLAAAIGLVSDPESVARAARADVARALAVEAAAAVHARDVSLFELVARRVIDDHSHLRSVGLRDDGGLIIDVGGHAARWSDPGQQPNASNIWLPVEMNGAPWGRVEFTFRPLSGPAFFGLLPGGPVGRLYAFVGALAFAAFALYLWFVLGRVFTAGEQSIPHRVRQALDTLVEGVLVLDRQQRIAHANAAFGKLIDRPASELIGKNVASLAWSPPRGVTFSKPGMPWSWAIQEGQSVNRVPLILQGAGDREHMLSVNATPVVGDDGTRRGALATFDDMTEMERKNASLHELLAKLKHSRAEIHRQNHELKLLANRDPLTLCLNRRAFFVDLVPLYEQAGRTGNPLSCLMVDVDRFKTINDRYGHAAGDQVLAQVAELLRVKSRHTDLVCRYGGEEFALILPQTDLDGASGIAERIRVALAEKPLAGVPVTASFGVSAISLGPNGPQGLLDQADKAMYAAKRSGRNRVTRYDELAADAAPAAAPVPDAEPPSPLPRPETAIPYPAVTALISALAYRDSLTAEHSRRVADLCVATARDLLSQSDVYLLEVAALLHDIGKLGVPDAILFKPGPLSEDEWKVMRLHDRMGVEIITAAFASEALTRVVAAHHAWYNGSPRDPGLPTGDAIPLPARILAVADAYDAMVSDRVYRKCRTRDQAFAELWRCAGTQFDPEIIDRVINAVRATQPNEPSSRDTPLLTKETALVIGTQIERLAGAIDERDVAGLAMMATQLVATAREYGVPAIIEVAGRLERAAAARADWLEIVGVTHDLLELCRSTQSIYLRDAREHPTDEFRRQTDDAALTERRTTIADTVHGQLAETRPATGGPLFAPADAEPATERINLPPAFTGRR